MTTPTDAQVAVVSHAIAQAIEETGNWKKAAEAAIAAYTTAAEVEPDEKLIERCKRLTKDRSEIEAATIERCERLIPPNRNPTFPDDWDRGHNHVCDQMRRNIHALKDKA